MIHVLTVHWRDGRWIDIQRRYLEKHMAGEWRIYAFLDEGLKDHRTKFDFALIEDVQPHAVKLNLLAVVASLLGREPSDRLIFLDGDAFPIADIVPFIEEKLAKYPLVAVQRKVEQGDIQPHPSFCATTIGFWREIDGDWKRGFCWENAAGEVTTDVGGQLLRTLVERDIDWYPMRRSNRVDLHPLLFAVYDGVVYHHGSGFHRPLSSVDFLEDEARRSRRGIMNFLLSAIPYTGRLGRFKRRLHPLDRYRERKMAANQALSEAVFARIVADEFFYREFLE